MSVHVLLLEQDQPADLTHYRSAISKACPQVILHVAATPVDALREAAGCSVLIAKAPAITGALVQAMPGLDWVQALTAGVERLGRIGLGPSVTVTSARGLHAPQMSELAVLMMLALLRDLPGMLAQQRSATWAPRPQPTLAGRAAVIVGVGATGEGLAALCKAFGMAVVGVSATPRPVPGFDRIVPYDHLRAAAAAADVLVVLCPYGAASHHLVGAALLAAMRPQAFVINLARGQVVDQAALVEALRAGRIGGAGLDVFEVEPLAADDPLWTMPNVIVTPHVGGLSDTYAERLTPMIIDNLQAYCAGGPGRVKQSGART